MYTRGAQKASAFGRKEELGKEKTLTAQVELYSRSPAMPAGSVGAVVGARRARKRREKEAAAAAAARGPSTGQPGREVTFQDSDLQYVSAPPARSEEVVVQVEPKGCCRVM